MWVDILWSHPDVLYNLKDLTGVQWATGLLVKLQSDEAAVDSMSIVAQTWGCQVFFEGTE